MVIVDSEGKVRGEPIIYRGPNVVKAFIECLWEEGLYIADDLQTDVGMIFTSEDEKLFEETDQCHICEKPIWGNKVRDHDHLTGKFRGVAHNDCNLNYRVNGKIPVIFHGLKHFDAHVLLKEAGDSLKNMKIDVIPNNSEQYTSFSIDSFQFLDSLQFMASSLEKLADNLDKNTAFQILKSLYPNDADRQLLLRKGVFPYEYLTDESKFEETSLPPKEEFYSRFVIIEDFVNFIKQIFFTPYLLTSY